MHQLKAYISTHKRQVMILIVLLPLLLVGVYLVLQRTVLNPRAGGGNTHALKIGLAAGAKTELAPNETTKVLVTADMGSENILGFDILLNYDAQMFDVSELKPGQIFDSNASGKGTVTVKSTENGQIKLSWAAFNQSTKQFITNMSASYGASSANIELLNVTLKAKLTASGNSQIGFGEISKNIIVTVEGGGNEQSSSTNKAVISSQRDIELEVNQGGDTGSASLSLSPASGSFKKGCNFSTQVVVNTAGKTIDGVDAVLTYDPSKLIVTSINNGTIFGSYPANTAGPQTKKISISGVASLNQSFQSNGVLATINFKVNETAAAGATTVSFDYISGDTTDSNIVEKDTIEDILSSVTNGNYTIEEGTCGTTSAPSKPVVTAACVGDAPQFLMSWTGTPGQGASGDTANVGKSGFYVDISTSTNFELVYNKFVVDENVVLVYPPPPLQTNSSGFVLANAERPDTGSPLVLTSGQGYFVRVFNGVHSPVSEKVVAPSC